MSITARKRKDGTTVYDVSVYTGFASDGTRDRKKVTCKTKRAAEVEQARLISKRDAMRGRSGRISVADYVDDHYWPAASRRLAATSLDTYEKEIRLRIKPALGHLDVAEVDRRAVQRMVDGCATKSVARKAVQVLKTIMNEAKGDGLVRSNPCDATFAYPTGGRKRDNGLVLTTFDEIAELLSIVRHGASQRLQRVAYTGLLQGLRPEERYALEWADVDLSAGVIKVDKARVSATPKHGGVHDKPTKTELSTRVVPMHPWFADWLSTVPAEGGPFVKSATGGRVSPATVQHGWAAFLRDHPEAPPVTLENMRHSFATSYLHAGGNVEDLSRILGHADINTTYRRYVRPSVDDLKRGMESLAL